MFDGQAHRGTRFLETSNASCPFFLCLVRPKGLALTVAARATCLRWMFESLAVHTRKYKLQSILKALYIPTKTKHSVDTFAT